MFINIRTIWQFAGNALRNRCTRARVAGSLVKGVRSASVGTSTLPLTLPRIFCWPAYIDRFAPRHSGRPIPNP